MSDSVKTITPSEISTISSIRYRMVNYVPPIIIAGTDCLATILALFSARMLRENWLPATGLSLPPFSFEHASFYFVVPLLYLFFFVYSGLYTKRLPAWKSIEEVFKSSIYVSVFEIVVVYLLGYADTISRIFIVLSGVLSFAYLCMMRVVIKRLLIYCSLWQKPVIMIGAGKTAELLARSFEDDPGLGYKIVGFIEDCEVRERPLLRNHIKLGAFSEAEQIIRDHYVQDVIIATPGLTREELIAMVYRVQPYVRNLTIVPDLFGMPLSNMQVETLFDEKTVMLKVQNNLAKRRNQILKRGFDLISCIIGGILISPILFIIAVLIYCSDPGPIFFAHERIGTSGKKFFCYKFRSMITNSKATLEQYLEDNPTARAEWKANFKLKEDPRVTRIGSFLRKTSLDELPQIINVIKGEMSLVGPRPIVDQEIIKYGDYIHDYYLVKPGITGYWQVSGRSDVDYDRRIKMDSWYVRNWSLWQDIVIMFKTVGVVVGKKGAY